MEAPIIASCQSQFDDGRERFGRVLQVETATTVAITDPADRRGFGRHSFCNMPERAAQVLLRTTRVALR
jgi:hypothetical protein